MEPLDVTTTIRMVRERQPPVSALYVTLGRPFGQAEEVESLGRGVFRRKGRLRLPGTRVTGA